MDRFGTVGTTILLALLSFAGARLLVVHRALDLQAQAAGQLLEDVGSPDSVAATAVLIFHEDDCPSSRRFSLALNDLSDTESVHVAGMIVGRHDSEHVEDVRRGLGFEFAVRDGGHLDLGSAFLRQIGYSQTPVVVLFDSAGRVRSVFAPSAERSLRAWIKAARSRSAGQGGP